MQKKYQTSKLSSGPRVKRLLQLSFLDWATLGKSNYYKFSSVRSRHEREQPSSKCWEKASQRYLSRDG